ncbi:MAG TPA: 7-carboxy-7-deazaguanine synthase QueE [Patescibacteria group bacterium]|nr:7-carboxy-7-deazaguanine synthase QueE [Patescibacteria group bacterium]
MSRPGVVELGMPYIPTDVERAATLARHPDDFRVSGDGVFATLQGEGLTAGAPVVFLRLNDCNLHCGKDGVGWRCDTDYTWDKTMPEYWRESRVVPVEDAAADLQAAWTASPFRLPDSNPRAVISGGEPMLQRRQIVRLLPHLPGWDVEIETNGTIVPPDELRVCQINCSPKLASSGNDLRARRRLDALRAIDGFPNHVFKFVIAEPEPDLAEVRELMEQVNGGDYERVLLMGEGRDPGSLEERHPGLVAFAGELGCGITDRNHVFWFGDRRRT